MPREVKSFYVIVARRQYSKKKNKVFYGLLKYPIDEYRADFFIKTYGLSPDFSQDYFLIDFELTYDNKFPEPAMIRGLEFNRSWVDD